MLRTANKHTLCAPAWASYGWVGLIDAWVDGRGDVWAGGRMVCSRTCQAPGDNSLTHGVNEGGQAIGQAQMRVHVTSISDMARRTLQGHLFLCDT